MTSDFLCGNSVSHNATFLFSDEWPVVAIRLQEPRNTKSLVTLLWHWNVLKVQQYIQIYNKYIKFIILNNSSLYLHKMAYN